MLPPFAVTLQLAAAGMLLALGTVYPAGWLKIGRRVPTAYTRKIFHFIVFTGATVVHSIGGFPAVNAYACGVVAVILAGVWRGKGSLLYEPLARERDEPYPTFFIVAPLVTTAAGGLVSNAVAGDFALVGYLVTGWGDAAGEPVGRWIGRRRYRVPTLMGVQCTRSIEGSSAVFVASFAAAALGLYLGIEAELVASLSAAFIIAIATTFLEGFSPHGMDNFTTMLGASVISWLVIAGPG